jgi:Sec-independent protein translocase protein TatA
MRTISIGQILVLTFICFLLFGDFNNLKKKVKTILKQIKAYFETSNRKKGT